MKLDLITLAQIDAWIKEEQDRANASQWGAAFKFGYGQGLLGIQVKMDTYRQGIAK